MVIQMLYPATLSAVSVGSPQSKCRSTVSVSWQCRLLVSAIDVGPCVTGLVMLNKFEFVTYSTNKSFNSSLNSECGAIAHCSVLFAET